MNNNLIDSWILYKSKVNGIPILRENKIISEEGNYYTLENSSVKLYKNKYGKNLNFGRIKKTEKNTNNNFKNLYKQTRIFICYKMPISPQLVSRWNCCLSNQGELCSPHITISRFDALNSSVLNQLNDNKNEIQNSMNNKLNQLSFKNGEYKILGKNISEKLRNKMFRFGDLNNLNNYLNQNDNIECYLARVFYIGDFRNVYDLIHSSSKSYYSDLEYYKRDDYKQFTIHLSLAKFTKLSNALNALKNIYENRFNDGGFQEIFNKQKYFSIEI
jgi:hypothetical protein